MTTPQKVAPGQVWAERSKYERGRTVQVDRITDQHDGFVYCTVLAPPDSRPAGRVGHTTRIRVTGLRARYYLAEVSS